ncbi:unnamed protein product [Dicrocoelium dendriticum]|nr:unnamed protein product [Dicrocoelium dendriticum]
MKLPIVKIIPRPKYWGLPRHRSKIRKILGNNTKLRFHFWGADFFLLHCDPTSDTKCNGVPGMGYRRELENGHGTNQRR